MLEGQALLDSASATQQSLPYGTAAEQSTLLGDTNAIRLYAQGLTVPGFDQALTEKYGRQSLDLSGRPQPNLDLPPALRSALQARQEMGLAIPRIPGFAQGGRVEQQLPGGAYDPITGRLVLPSGTSRQVQETPTVQGAAVVPAAHHRKHRGPHTCHRRSRSYRGQVGDGSQFSR